MFKGENKTETMKAKDRELLVAEMVTTLDRRPHLFVEIFRLFCSVVSTCPDGRRRRRLAIACRDLDTLIDMVDRGQLVQVLV